MSVRLIKEGVRITKGGVRLAWLFILLIEQLLNRLTEATIFKKLNIRFEYNALRIRANDK